MRDADVIIVGAGPAGSITATELARRGYRPILIEKDEYAGKTNVCGGSMTAEFARAIEIRNDVVEGEIDEWICYFPDKKYVIGRKSVSVRREVFDRWLSERAEDEGCELRRSTLVYGVERRPDGIVAHLRDRVSRQTYQLRAKLAVFADGPNTLANRFGIGFKCQPDNTAQGGIFELEKASNGFDRFKFFFDTKISRWGYGWIFPKKGHLNVGAGVLMSTMRGEEKTRNIRARLDYLSNEHPVASKDLSGRRLLRFASAPLPLAIAGHLSGNRIVVVGDAAGMVDPVWGGGIEYAGRAAIVAARVVSQALENKRYDACFLSGFEAAWKKTKDYQTLRKLQWLSRFFFSYSTLDKAAYLKMVAWLLERGGASESRLDN